MHLEAEIAKTMASIRVATRSTTTIETSCKDCSGDGWVLVGPDGMRVPTGKWVAGQKMIPCECQVSTRVARRIPKVYQNAKLEHFKATTIERVDQFFHSDSPGLLLSGPAGVGKTYLAAAIARVLLEEKADVLFRGISRIFSELRECMQRDESEEALLSRYIDVTWLVLDDFGAGSFSDFERRVALDLLNRRANEGRRTIVTTNVELAVIAERLDERIASRLSAFDRIVAQGADRRAQK